MTLSEINQLAEQRRFLNTDDFFAFLKEVPEFRLENGAILRRTKKGRGSSFIQLEGRFDSKGDGSAGDGVHYEIERSPRRGNTLVVALDVEQPNIRDSAALIRALEHLASENGLVRDSERRDPRWQHQPIDYNAMDVRTALATIWQCLQSLYTTFEPTIKAFESVDKGTKMNAEIQELLKSNLNVILTGAPGTGKTYMAKAVAKELAGDESRIASVQFHPGYDYSDFVVGMKPDLVGEGDEKSVSFGWKDGIFKKFADKAKDDLNHNYVFLIDEINRADLSRVFGELFSLLEEEYRYPNNEKGITLPNGESFVIPRNLYILGTMNDIDRSVESMDFALRRRFAWKAVKAGDTRDAILDAVEKDGRRKIKEADAAKLKAAMNELNREIGGEEGAKLDLRLGTAYQLGGAIFAKFERYAGNDNSFENLWKNHIENTLSEYLRGRREAERLLLSLKIAYETAVGKTSQGDSTQDSQSTTPETQREAPPAQT